MYCVNLNTGETTFRTVRPKAGHVELVVMPEHQPSLRVGMELRDGVWETETHLPAGWLFYAFEVDGRLDWDRDASRLRTRSGTRCSLALIASVKRKTLNPVLA
ncbi:MAG TPA: hypothetical protein VGH19_22120 [Verrucomicrobiae bacterium]